MHKENIKWKLNLLIGLVGVTINGKIIRSILVGTYDGDRMDEICRNHDIGNFQANHEILDGHKYLDVYAIFSDGKSSTLYDKAENLAFEIFNHFRG